MVVHQQDYTESILGRFPDEAGGPPKCVPTPYVTVMRLTMLGMFFNLVVPGLTGGDIVKVVQNSKINKKALDKAVNQRAKELVKKKLAKHAEHS